MIVLIALVSGALVVTGLPAQITGHIGTAVCQITARDCEPVHTAASNGAGGQGGTARTGPRGIDEELESPITFAAPEARGASDGSSDTAAAKPSADDYWSCGWFGQTACDMTQGFGRATADWFTDTAESACLIHLCSHSGFLNAWKGTIDGVKSLFTDPGPTLTAMWEESTKDIREDWNNGHKASAITRVVPRALSTLFGIEAASKLRKLRNNRTATKAATLKAEMAEKVDKATRLAGEAAQAAEQAAAKGDVKAAEIALKEADEHIREADRAAKKSLTGENQNAATTARERVAEARNTLTDTAIRQIMVKSRIGRQAQKILKTYRTPVRYRRGEGTFFDPADKTIYIDTKMPQTEQALALIHESTHAEYRHTGRTVNGRPLEFSRSEYIDGAIREEAEGAAREFEASRELREQGVKLPKSSLEEIYKKAYDDAVEAADQEAHGLPSMSELDRAGVGRRAGTEALLDEYRSGRITGSVNGMSYGDLAGSVWDDAHVANP